MASHCRSRQAQRHRHSPPALPPVRLGGSPIFQNRRLLLVLAQRLVREDRHRARPASGRGLDLHGKAGDQEAGGRQAIEVGELFEVAIADVPPGLVPFPDKAGVFRLCISLRGEAEGRVPAPRIGAGNAHAPFKEIECRLAPHAAASREIVFRAICGPGGGVDHHDLKRLQRVPDPGQLGFDIRAVTI